MKHRLLFSFLLLLTVQFAFAQNNIDTETIRNAQRNVCAIKIIDKNTDQTIALGCGVVLMTKVKQQNEYFVATAFHIARNLLAGDNVVATISVFDKNGNIYTAEPVTGNHILWKNLSMDAALLVLPRDLQPGGDLPDNYEFPGLANLKLIGEPDWGEDIYLFGYRWINEDRFIDILKKGVLSVGTKDLPGYEGNLVYLIDNMANKGMSGGLAFNSDGVGIGIISSYVYETDNAYLNSDDLTVCLPLTIYFNVLGTMIINQADMIYNILQEE